MSNSTFKFSEADIKRIKRVQFGILSPDECKAMSVCAIEHERCFDAGRPVQGGLMDPRLGSIDKSFKCATCGMDHQDCPGHFGHIELAKPMYHVSFLDTIVKALRCVCFSCSAILADEPADEATGAGGFMTHKLAAAVKKKNPALRLRAVMDLCRGRHTCWSCSAAQPNFRRDGLSILAECKEATDEHERKVTNPPPTPPSQPSRLPSNPSLPPSNPSLPPSTPHYPLPTPPYLTHPFPFPSCLPYVSPMCP